ncbi:hypothetical protein D9M71_176300 [compost metagenome]
MLGQDHLDLVAIGVDGLVQGLPPVRGIAHLRAAQGIEVVQGVRGVFGGVEQFELREPDEHFRRRLGARGHLERR